MQAENILLIVIFNASGPQTHMDELQQQHEYVTYFDGTYVRLPY